MLTTENLGRSLDAATIEKGLRELNSDISLDCPVKRPSEWTFFLETAKKQKGKYEGIYYKGRHICPMDRGASIPEHKIFGLEDGLLDIPMSDIDRYTDSRVAFVEILKTDPFYHEALLKAQRKDDNYTFGERGKLFRYSAFRHTKVRGPVLKIGWRHTFECLIAAKIPGVTRRSLEEKFEVNMRTLPVAQDQKEVKDILRAV